MIRTSSVGDFHAHRVGWSNQYPGSGVSWPKMKWRRFDRTQDQEVIHADPRIDDRTWWRVSEPLAGPWATVDPGGGRWRRRGRSSERTAGRSRQPSARPWRPRTISRSQCRRPAPGQPHPVRQAGRQHRAANAPGRPLRTGASGARSIDGRERHEDQRPTETLGAQRNPGRGGSVDRGLAGQSAPGAGAGIGGHGRPVRPGRADVRSGRPEPAAGHRGQ
jgi:hypothetical protein